MIISLIYFCQVDPYEYLMTDPWMAHLWQPPLHSFILGVASRGADGEGEQRVNCVVNSSIGRGNTVSIVL